MNLPPPDPSVPAPAAPAPGPNPAATDQTTLVLRSGDAASVAELPPLPLPPPEVPGYEILGEVGRGGMGVVYRARQVALNRVVALKMILAGGHAGPRELARFRAEAEAIAHLHHPNIVQVYEVGEADGHPYFSMEYVGGGALHERIADYPQPVGASALLVEQLARALHYAHRQGIVHRDLKPGNVLLSVVRGPWSVVKSGALPDGGVAPGFDNGLRTTDYGQPKITDFGLARRIDAAGPALTGSVYGTPAYMAPELTWEAAGGPAAPPGPAVDVYGLGTILYELLTGRAPFHAPTPMDTLLQVRLLEPIPPRSLRPDVAADLQTVCLKCLQKNPARRYATADELADDLRRFLDGEPITARPVSTAERLAKWGRRRPVVAGLIAALAAMALVGLAGMALEWQATAEARDEAVRAGLREAEQRQLAVAHLYVSRVAQAQLQRQAHNLGQALALLDRCPEDLRGWEWHYLRRLCRPAAPDPDGRTLAGPATAPALGLAFHPDGRRLLAIRGGAEPLEEWDAATGERAGRPGPASFRPEHAFSPDRTLLAQVAPADPRLVTFCDTVTGRRAGSLEPNRSAVTALAFSPDGRRLATVESASPANNLVRIRDVATGEEHGRFTLRGRAVRVMAFSPDGRRLALGGGDDSGTELFVCDADGGRQLDCGGAPAGGVSHLTFSPDGTRLAAACPGEPAVRVWAAAADGGPAKVLTGPCPFGGVAFSPDGRRIAGAGLDPVVQLWDAATGEEVLTLLGRAGRRPAGRAFPARVAFGPDGRRLAAAHWDGSVSVWDAGPRP